LIFGSFLALCLIGLQAFAADVTVGLSLGSTRQERWLREKDIIEEQLKAAGAKLVVAFADMDADKQEPQCKAMIDSDNIKVLIITAQDSEKAKSIVDYAHSKGVKVIAYDRLIKNCDLDAYLSFDNVKVGEFEAKGVVQAVSKGNFVYIGGSPTDNNAHLVKKGSMNILQPLIDSGAIKLVHESFTPEWSAELAYETVAEVLEQNGNDIQAIVCANDGTAAGAIEALEEVGLSGKVPVSGQDAELAACRRIVEGTQTVSVYKPGRKMAIRAAEIALAMINNRPLGTDSTVNNGKIEVPSILLEPVMVTKDNIKETVVADGYHSNDDIYVFAQ